MKVIVTSKNPVKLQSAKDAFTKVFSGGIEFDTIAVPSNVSDQPMSDQETLLGAKNRVKHAVQAIPGADYYVGIEAGVEMVDNELTAFAWVYIQDQSGKKGSARSAAFFLPHAVKELIDQGMELGVADDIVFKRENSKHSEGAIGLLTDNHISRTELYAPAVIMALIPFIKSDFF